MLLPSLFAAAPCRVRAERLRRYEAAVVLRRVVPTAPQRTILLQHAKLQQRRDHWEQWVDRSSGGVFYLRTDTQETQWAPPLVSVALLGSQ